MRRRSYSLLFAVLALMKPAVAFGDEPPARADESWWSLQPITRPALPVVRDRSRVRNAVDAFVTARLESHGLSLGVEADRRTLVRRLKNDLHGLPPTLAELQEFENDSRSDAYEQLVDRLLASPHYGERWARHWLDVVRFSESNGYERDRIRENAWHYRDWVIRAFNEGMPYGDFVLHQLAGDAIDPDDSDAAVPTGFLVTGPNNDVGNQSQLELMRERADELDEIVQNVSSVFLGLTVACARCHDHKFDPVPTLDYYRMAAVFSGVKFGDRPLESAADSVQRVARLAANDARTKEIAQQLADIAQKLRDLGVMEAASPLRNEDRFTPVRAKFVRLTIRATRSDTEPCIDELEIYGPESDENLALADRGAKATASSLLPGFDIHQIEHLNDGRVGNSRSWISNEKGAGWAQIELPEETSIDRIVWGRDRSGQFTDRVPTSYDLTYSTDGAAWHVVPREPPPAESQKQIAVLRDQQRQLEAERKELASYRAASDRLPKAWAALSHPPAALKVLKRGDVLMPGEDAPPGTLTAVQFPLDPLESTADLEEPRRRLELAHWIADRDNPLTWRVMANRVWHYHFGVGLVATPSDFGASGGLPSHPELLEYLADELRTSGQLKSLHRLIVCSATYRQADRTDGEAIDADNRLLWRPNRRRLDAETLRDSVLFTSGSLDRRMLGPSYRTFRYIDGNIPVYEPMAENAETWRRTVYRHAVRTHRQPFLDTFDCPDPSVMTPDRAHTTTPLQALSLLNNAFMFEQSERLAERVRREVGADTAGQVAQAFRLVLLRDPTHLEHERALALVEQHGLTSLCRVLFNTNEFLYVE